MHEQEVNGMWTILMRELPAGIDTSALTAFLTKNGSDVGMMGPNTRTSDHWTFMLTWQSWTQWDIDCAGNVASLELIRIPNINICTCRGNGSYAHAPASCCVNAFKAKPLEGAAIRPLSSQTSSVTGLVGRARVYSYVMGATRRPEPRLSSGFNSHL